MSDKQDERERRATLPEPEPDVVEPGEVDAAESRWDPWLAALARLEEEGEARPN